MARMVRRELRQEFKIGMEKSVGKIWTEIVEAVINEKDISGESIDCEAQETFRVAIEVQNMKNLVKSQFVNLESDKKVDFKFDE